MGAASKWTRYEQLVRQLYQVRAFFSHHNKSVFDTLPSIQRPTDRRTDGRVRALDPNQVNLYCAAKLGLENITALHQALGCPLERIPNIVHVGGA